MGWRLSWHAGRGLAGRYALELRRVDVAELGLFVDGFDRIAGGGSDRGVRLLLDPRGLLSAEE
jgi:hypothetical protein